MSAKKEDISFDEWLRLACTQGGLLLPLLCIFAVLFAAVTMAIAVPIVGVPLVCGLGLAFWLTLRYAWHQDCKNPPWYLRKEQEDEETAHD